MRRLRRYVRAFGWRKGIRYWRMSFAPVVPAHPFRLDPDAPSMPGYSMRPRKKRRR